MFTYPATELFNASGDRRVVWSEQEHERAIAEGWSHEQPAPAEPAPKSESKPKGK